MIHFTCPRCAKKLKGPDSLAGGRADCPQCGHGIAVPLVSVDDEPGRELLHWGDSLIQRSRDFRALVSWGFALAVPLCLIVFIVWALAQWALSRQGQGP
jgi:DNA-directed RNA polymerase subunit RPC12/RpoP